MVLFQVGRRAEQQGSESPLPRVQQRTPAAAAAGASSVPLAADSALDGTFMILFSWHSEYSRVRVPVCTLDGCVRVGQRMVCLGAVCTYFLYFLFLIFFP